MDGRTISEIIHYIALVLVVIFVIIAFALVITPQAEVNRTRCIFDCINKKVPGWDGVWSRVPEDVHKACIASCGAPTRRALVAALALSVIALVTDVVSRVM